MNNLLGKREDDLNPIFYYDLKKAVKSKFFLFKILLFLLIYFLVILILLIARQRKDVCLLAFFLFSSISLIFIPLELRKLSFKETYNDNIFFYFMSNITATDYIKGRLYLGIFYNAILNIVAFPLLASSCYFTELDFYTIIYYMMFNFLVPIPVYFFSIYKGINHGFYEKGSHFYNVVFYIMTLLLIGSILFLVILGIITHFPIVESFILDFIIITFILLVPTIIVVKILYLLLNGYIIKEFPLSAPITSSTPVPPSDKAILEFDEKVRKRKAFEVKA